MLHIENIGPVTSVKHGMEDKKLRKLAFDTTAPKKKTYIWRFLGYDATKERNRWMNGMRRHQKSIRELKDYLTGSATGVPIIKE